MSDTDEPTDGSAEAEEVRARLKKAPHAFRTISEVADELHIPQHVLRFWETKFGQVRPLKRGGGRRYYRPDDIQLLRRISDLLYIQGYTIKGVQRLLREGGGALSDDIPPAPALEQVEAAAERSRPVETAVEPAQLGLLPDAMAPVPMPPSSGDTEAVRLRRQLVEVLSELRALRAAIG